MIIHYSALIVIVLAITIKFDVIFLFLDEFYSRILVGNERTKLLVGILSAPSNVRARKAIRETWGQFAANRSIEIKFLIGSEICPYPVEDRVTPYNCDLWLINLPQDLDEYSTAGNSIRSEACDIGFTFIVKTRIMLHQIGLDYEVFSGNATDKARVVLYNSKTGKKVASATFMKEPIFGFVWKPIPGIKLGEGFEGELKLVGSGLHTSHCEHILQYVAPVYFFETLDETGNYSKYELGDFRTSVVGMNYTLEGISGLEEVLVERVERFKRWSLTTTLLKQQLEDELERYGDILFLSGFIDVYDNLSIKVSVFLDWVKMMNKWNYILKTDDDVFVDLPLVEKGLEGSWNIWTCMRNQTPNLWGKWRDRSSPSYPPFPSGSGYIFSRQIAYDLQVNPIEKLGEDVMMGYALERNVNEPLDAPCCWACGSLEADCDAVCNMPELSPGQLRKLWEIYEEIGRVPTYHEM